MVKKILLLAAGIVLFLATAGLLAYGGIEVYFKIFAKKKISVNYAVVDIPYGTSLKKVSEILYQQNVISDPFIYYWYIRRLGDKGGKIQAGYYEVSGTFTNEELLERLRYGRDQSLKITFREGETLNDLVRRLEEHGLVKKEDFCRAMNESVILENIPDPLVKARKELLNDMGGLEGYLFPDTYFFPKNYGAARIIRKMHQRLLDKMGQEFFGRMLERNMSLHELLTRASIVEKETKLAVERPLVASIIDNRLAKKMRLQADPTVIYGIKDYRGKIRKADLLTDHAYNTYRIPALPPGPIAAAGLDSIRAVLWPASSQYLYFVSKNDGTHLFCEDLKCHNRAVKKWQIDYFKLSNRR
jgi:UPF0755 protein